MHTYLLLLHEKPADAAQVSAAEMKEIVARYQTWSRGLAERGLLLGGEKLTDEGGQQLRLKAGVPVATDGPYAEAHDVVGGYFSIKAENDAAAVTIAKTCPHLVGSQWVEVRRVEVLGA